MVTEHLLCEARSRDGVLSWRCSVRARFLARVLRAAPGSGSCGGAHPAGEVSLESANALHVLLALLGLAVLEGGDFLWFHRLLYPALAPVLLLGTAAFASVAFTPSRIARVLWLGAAGVYLVLAIRTAISGDLVARARGVHEQHRAESRAARVFRSALLPDESLCAGSATTGSSKRAPASFRITPDALLVCARTSAESFADIMRVSASARHQ